MAIPKPIAVSQEYPGQKVLVPLALIEEMKGLVSGVLVDIKGANPRIYQINPAAWERWHKTLAVVEDKLGCIGVSK